MSSNFSQDGPSAKERFALACGLIYVILISGLIVLPPAPEINPGASTEQIASTYASGRAGFLTEGLVASFMWIGLLIFAAGLCSFLHRAEGESGVFSRLAFGSAVALTALATVIDTVVVATANVAAQEGSPAVVGGLHQLQTDMGAFVSFPMMLFLATASAVMLGTRIVPRWIGWLGLVATLGFAVGTPTIFNPDSPFGLALAIGAPLHILWITATSIVLIRRSRKGRAASQVATPS
jgi:hypothetical protein